MATRKKNTKKPAEETPQIETEVTTGYMQVVSEIELRPSSQYLFVSDRGVQLSDGITLELRVNNCETVTVMWTDTKHRSDVVKDLIHDGDKMVINADHFGESKTLLYTVNATTPEGFAISACSSVYKIVLEAGVFHELTDDDIEAQEAVVDDFFKSMTKERVPSLDESLSSVTDIDQIMEEADDCLDCQIEDDVPAEIWSPVAEAQLIDWEEITDEVSRKYVWADHNLTIVEPRALFYKKDALGVTTVVLDAHNVAFEIPPGFQYLVRQRRRK